jgi:hypothetical protein
MKKFALLALVSLWASQLALAADQSVTLQTGVEHDTNPALRASGATPSITRYRLTPQYQKQWGSELDAYTLSARVLFERSSDTAVSQNRQDPSLDASWQRQTSRGSFRLQGSLASASARSAALADTGQVVQDGTRISRSIKSDYSHALTEVDTLNLGANYQAVSFTKQSQTNYRETSASLKYGRQIAEKTDAFVEGVASRYEPGAQTTLTSPSASSKQTVSFGLRHQLASKFNLQGQAGLLRIPGNGSSTKSGQGWQGSLSLNHQGDRFSGSLQAGRAGSVNNLDGGYVVTDSLRVQESYLLAEDTQIGAQASFQRTNSVTTSKSTSAGVDLNQRLGEFWRLNVNVLHREVSSANQGVASGALIGAQLVFTEPNF